MTENDLLEYNFEKIYDGFDDIYELSTLIVENSNTRDFVEIDSKFTEEYSILEHKLDIIKKNVNDI